MRMLKQGESLSEYATEFWLHGGEPAEGAVKNQDESCPNCNLSRWKWDGKQWWCHACGWWGGCDLPDESEPDFTLDDLEWNEQHPNL